MSSLLDVRDVTVRFRLRGGLVQRLVGGRAEVEAVAGVSLDLEQGSTLALVGESGSGKSTLARAVAGLLPVAAGSIVVAGRAVTAASPPALKAIRRDIGMVFQNPVGSLSPRMRVGELLAEPFTVHRVRHNARAEARRLLELVGLPEAFAQRFPHQLSGGQARRVGVARALALGPKLIIADEPTAGLDVSVQGEVLNLLSRLRDQTGVALLIITHNLHVARHVADRIAVMYLGRIVEHGDAGDVFAQPRHPYAGALLAASPEPDPGRRARRLKLGGEVPSLRARPSGCEFHTRCPVAREVCAVRAPGVHAEGTRRFTCMFPL